jgi:hypothetical protein
MTSQGFNVDNNESANYSISDKLISRWKSPISRRSARYPSQDNRDLKVAGMALSARRNLVRLQDKKGKLETEISIAEDSTVKPQGYKFDLLPVVSSFTKSLPLRRRSRLPFASMSTSNFTRPNKGELTSPSEICLLEFLIKLVPFH